jgi:endo-1,4-beta-xylanase
MRSAAWAGFLAVSLTASAHAPTSLKEAYKGDFLIGAAMNAALITGEDARGDAIIETQFNAISPADALKWAFVHPQPGKYDFTLADQYVAFGLKHHMNILGHNLVWHEEVPGWVFRDSKGHLLSRDALLARMRRHIQTVVGRYKGKINCWDVVNEALNEDGTMRQSLWYKIIGPDYIEKAFEYAHEADPHALLGYNDYNLEKPAKRKAAIALVKRLKADGIPIAYVGLQDHDSLTWPTVEQEDATISAFAALGVKVAISELDINVLPTPGGQPTADVNLHIRQNPKLNPYVNGLPESVQKELAARYAGLFRVFLKHRGQIMRVTFWGVTNGDSWLNNWPVKGRTDYPLLFGRNGSPNLSFDAVMRVASEASRH